MKLLRRIEIFRKKMRRDFISTKDLLGDRYQIGEHTYGKPRVIDRGEMVSLRIGKYCSISTQVIIFLGSEHRMDWVSTYPFPYLWKEASSTKGHPFSKGDVIIGNDVYIGYHVTILSGVTIGDGAAIGAGSVVTKDIPPYAIAAGNPAQIIRYRFGEETIQKLLKIRWWDWSDEKVKENVHLICCDSIDAFVKKFG
jgi:acetyltransferase-like isoleucine patch superfamily enzyme